MAQYGRIENGILVQKQPNPADGFVEIPDNVICGMLFDGDVFTAPELPEPAFELPSPSELVMTGSGLRVDGWNLVTDVVGFNFGGGFKEETGIFICFPLMEIAGPIDCWFSVGGGFTLIGILLDPYTIRIEARDMNGNLADPERFSMRIYQP